MSETREEYNTGQGQPELEAVIIQRLIFADGSEIIVTVKAPRGEWGPGLLEKDLASRAYYAYLLEKLNLIETISKGPG